jgi:hypothetical protein
MNIEMTLQVSGLGRNDGIVLAVAAVSIPTDTVAPLVAALNAAA